MSMLLLTPLIFGLALPSASGGGLVSDFERDRFCGPRCIQRVLRYYDIHADLVDLIRVVRPGPDGSSFLDLQRVLNHYGISTVAVDLPNRALLEWDGPAIVAVAMRPSNHFIVWLPAKDAERPHLWDGSFNHPPTATAFLHRRTGPVLLTSATPFTPDATFGIEFQPLLSFPTQAILLFIGALIAGWSFGLPTTSRSDLSSPEHHEVDDEPS